MLFTNKICYSPHFLVLFQIQMKQACWSRCYCLILIDTTTSALIIWAWTPCKVFSPLKNRLNYKLHHLVLPKIYFIIFVQFSTLTFNFCSNLVIPLESVRIARLTFNFVQYKTLKLHCFGGSFMAKFWQINGGRAELNKVERWMHESEVLTKRYSNVNRKINHHSY